MLFNCEIRKTRDTGRHTEQYKQHVHAITLGPTTKEGEKQRKINETVGFFC